MIDYLHFNTELWKCFLINRVTGNSLNHYTIVAVGYQLLPFYSWTEISYHIYIYINVGKYRRGNQKWTIQRNWQHRVHKTKKDKTKTQHNICWTPLYPNNLNKTWALIQTTRGKDEPNIVFIMTECDNAAWCIALLIIILQVLNWQ